MHGADGRVGRPHGGKITAGLGGIITEMAGDEVAVAVDVDVEVDGLRQAARRIYDRRALDPGGDVLAFAAAGAESDDRSARTAGAIFLRRGKHR